MRRHVSLLRSLARVPHLVIAALAIFLTAAPTYADSVCQIAKLLASDGAESDHFGNSVAISGTTAIVGAPAAATFLSTVAARPGKEMR